MPEQENSRLLTTLHTVLCTSKIDLSNIIRRHDSKEERLKDKVINTNTLLALEGKKRKIDLIDNISVTGIGRKGLHSNNLGKEQTAANNLKYVKSI